MLKTFINQVLASLGGYRLCSTQPRGRFMFEDLRRSLGQEPVVFDIGANHGGWCLDCLQELGNVGRMFCFEPMPELFDELKATVAGLPVVECHPLALSDAVGSALLYFGSHGTTHSLVPDSADHPSVTVPVSTLDAFCESHHILAIDLVKIDTEGNDLKVLQGADEWLRSGRIRFLIVEVAINPGGKLVPLEVIRAHLQERSYRLFGLYDQQPEWDGRPGLLYANACFVHQHG